MTKTFKEGSFFYETGRVYILPVHIALNLISKDYAIQDCSLDVAEVRTYGKTLN